MLALHEARVGFSSGSSHTQKSRGVLDLFKQERVDKGIETDGSNLSGVSAKCAWDDLSRPPEDDEDSRSICIGTQPRRLSGKGKRTWAELLSWPFALFSDWFGQHCGVHLKKKKSALVLEGSVCLRNKMYFGVASLRKTGGKEIFALFSLNTSFRF